LLKLPVFTRLARKVRDAINTSARKQEKAALRTTMQMIKRLATICATLKLIRLPKNKVIITRQTSRALAVASLI
jgi:hypothetical protein